MKKLLVLTIVLLMLISLGMCPAYAMSTGNVILSEMKVNPGHLRWDDPTYNYAWLDNMIIRDDAMAATQAHVIPKPTDYPYSTTYADFVKESGDFNSLIAMDKESVTSAYGEVIDVMYYLVVAMGMTDDTDVMTAYLVEQGIRLPANAESDQIAAIAVVYAAIKYDAVYTLYGKRVEFPRGTTLDSAVVTIMAALTDTSVPSDVDSLSGYAVYCTKTYVTSFDGLPISTNPSDEEIFYWAKVVTAASSGDYQVPVEAYPVTSDAQKEYVNYAYCATILSDLYDVKINPLKLVAATQSGDQLAVQKLILCTMLDEKKVSYSNSLTCQELFDLACQNGCFNLEEEFYTDVLNYEIEVAQDCEKIWFTPFPLSSQLENGSDEYLTIILDGTPVAPSSTTGVALNPALSTETVKLEVYYNAPDNQDSAVYEFKLVKNAALNSSTGTSDKNDMVAEIQQYVNSIVPSGNDKATAIIDGVFQNIDSNGSAVGEGILTTYVAGSSSPDGVAPSGADTGFEYLDELLGDIYETDVFGNIITTQGFDYNETTTEKQSIITKTVETVKENPEIVAAPTGLIAVGAFAGYLMTKKHRDSEEYFDEDSDNGEDTEN
jgi:hypothetical protein